MLAVDNHISGIDDHVTTQEPVDDNQPVTGFYEGILLQFIVKKNCND
jgi:hypothetical protein